MARAGFLEGVPEKDIPALLALQRERDIAEARTDFNTFAELVCKDDETGEPIRQAAIHRAWTKAAAKYPSLLIWAHRFAGKTVQLSILRTVWELGKDSSLRFIILSATQDLAAAIVAAIASYIKFDETVREIFPNLRPEAGGLWSQLKLDVEGRRDKRNPSVRACGVGTALRGSRGDRLIIDDILTSENVATAEQRRKVTSWVRSEAFGCLSRRGRVLIVGNAMHPDDLLHELAKLQGWKWLRFPILNKAGESTWPDAWPMERVNKTRIDMGLEFAKNMMCRARSDEDARFKQDWIDEALKKGAQLTLIDSLEEVPEGCTTWTGVDLGVSKKKKSDKTAFFTFLEDQFGNRTLLNLQAGKYTGPEIVEKLIQLHLAFHSMISVENNACFEPTTRVLTNEGYKSIAKITPGELVWTHKGRWRKVLQNIEGESRLLVTAKARGCLPVRVTPNHWFWMREAGRTPGRGGGHYRPRGEARWISYGMRDREAYTAVAKPVWEPRAPMLHLAGSNREAACDVSVDESLALALGLYIAEGHDTKGQVFWTFHHNKEEHLTDLVCEQTRRLTSNSVTVRNNGSTARVVVSSTRLANALRLGPGRSKAVPKEWFGWPLLVRLAIVRGWFMGDGSVSSGTGGGKYLCGNTTSRDVALFIQATLFAAGICTGISEHASRAPSVIGEREIHTGPIFRILLSRDGSEALSRYMTSETERVHWEDWRAFHTAPTEVKHRSPEQIISDEEHAWVKVPAMTDHPFKEYNGKVHNLVVEEDESYTAENYIVHNAQDFILQFAKNVSNIPVLPHTTTGKKRDPILGVEGLAIELSNGKWTFPSMGGNIAPQLNEFIVELLYYVPKAHTGDRLMACYFARELARRILGVRTGAAEVQVTIVGSDEAPSLADDEPSDLERLFDVPETRADKLADMAAKAIASIRARIDALKGGGETYQPPSPDVDDEAQSIA